MFLSADDLKLAYGVDMQIARCYVDRKVPHQNAYWEKRHLYIPPVIGYYFMPIFSDLAFRVGVPKSELLSDAFLVLAERILDSAARLEKKYISWVEHVDECLAMAAEHCSNKGLLEDLTQYLKGDRSQSSVRLGTAYPSLNRADTYLCSLCCISFNDDIRHRVVGAWYALMTYFLILDDLADIRDDIINREENAMLEAGLTDKGVDIITRMIDESHDSMQLINPVMANRIDHKRQSIDVASIISAFREDTA